MVAVINTGGLTALFTNIGFPIGGIAADSDVLLYTSLDDEGAIMSPEKGIGGYSSMQSSDFVSAKDGNGVLFNRVGSCDSLELDEVSFPAWEGDEKNIELEAGEMSFWYQPLYNSTDAEGVYTLVDISLDGDSPSSIILFFNDGYFNLNVVDNEKNFWGTSAGYRTPIWSSGDWVHIHAVWDSSVMDDSLQLYVDDLRVDSGGASGGWQMDAGELATRIYLGSLPPCGEESANGIIDEFIIRRR
jgi:hypothetical protein